MVLNHDVLLNAARQIPYYKIITDVALMGTHISNNVSVLHGTAAI